MPTLLQMRIPLTSSPSEFEDIVRSALKVRWNSPNLQRFGRNGQSQYGVDISGLDEVQRFVGVQCRGTESMTIKEFKIVAVEAEKFEPNIEAFYLASGTSRDARFQKEVLLYSKQRKQQKRFPVGVIFWEDIYEELVTDVLEFAKHYPQFVPPQYVANAVVQNVESAKSQIEHKYFRAAQEIYALQIELTAGMNVSPELELTSLKFVYQGL